MCIVMIEVEEGIALFEQELIPKKRMITVPLEEAVGKVLAEDVKSAFPVPHFPKSAMDGYAVHHQDVQNATRENPVRLQVICEICAGDYTDLEYVPGTAVRVMTGGYIPTGYTAVVKQEDTDYGESEVLIYNKVKEYQNYCKVGEDIPGGASVLEKGTFLTPVHAGLLASLGIGQIDIIEPVKVAVISTGSELLQIGDEICPGKIYNSISYMLSASIRGAGFEVISSEICQDDETALIEDLQKAITVADVVITTGGVSVGKKDFMPEVLPKLGAKVLFHGANIQPGTPTMGSVLNGKAILSLSGNPYAAMANFELYFWKIACRLMNCNAWLPKIEKVTLESEYKKVNRLRRLVRAYAVNGQVWIPTEVHSSSVISTLTQCNCFIDIEAGMNLQQGDMVTVRYFDFT